MERCLECIWVSDTDDVSHTAVAELFFRVVLLARDFIHASCNQNTAYLY